MMAIRISGLNEEQELTDWTRTELVMEWADDHYWFDTAFVESLQTWISEKGPLTDGQREALDNIIAKLGIDE